MKKSLEAFDRLIHIMDDLREKCPWDKKQTLDSLKKLTIEETYELVDAISEKDMLGIEEELGDLFLHMVFYAKIGSEKKAFDLASVLNKVCDKLINRHPHIYSSVQVSSEEEVKQNWEEIKLKEGKKSVLQGVPKSLPSMIKAFRIQEKVAQIGFDWNDESEVLAKIEEEIEEFKHEKKVKNQERMEAELGDVFFALINYARHHEIDPESALERTNKKFIKRFQQMEQLAEKKGSKLKNLSLEEKEELWQHAKKLQVKSVR